MSTESERLKRAERIIERCELHTVPSEHGGYFKVCAQWRKKSGGKKRAGTFARVMLGTPITESQMRMLVKESVLAGRVLNIDEAKAVLFASALVSAQQLNRPNLIGELGDHALTNGPLVFL